MGDNLKVAVVFEKNPYDLFAFTGFEGADRIEQEAAGLDGLGRVPEQPGLNPGQFGQFAQRQPPLDFRVAAQRPGAGTGRIEQHGIEGIREE